MVLRNEGEGERAARVRAGLTANADQGRAALTAALDRIAGDADAAGCLFLPLAQYSATNTAADRATMPAAERLERAVAVCRALLASGRGLTPGEVGELTQAAVAYRAATGAPPVSRR